MTNNNERKNGMKINKNEIEVIDQFNERIVLRPYRILQGRAYLTERQYDKLKNLGDEWQAWDSDGERITLDTCPEY